MEHFTNMCPTLQETESDNVELVGAIGGIQYGRQLYQTRPQQYRSSPSQGQYAVPRLGPTPNMLALNHNYYQQPIGQLANSVSQLQLADSGNLTSQPILNPKGGNVSAVTLRSGKELQVAPQSKPNPTDIKSDPEANSRAKTNPIPFPSRTISAKKPETDEELLKMFQRVEINIPLLDAIKQIPKYAKFLKALCVNKRNKLKEGTEVGGVSSAFIQKEATTGTKPALPRKCRDLGIFLVTCPIGNCTSTDAMLDLGASINIMPASVYRSLNFGDLEPTSVVIQLGNRSVVQLVNILKDVLVQTKRLEKGLL
ncbi:hypothetical protein CR513_21483, partial [Mucuna pruriens]